MKTNKILTGLFLALGFSVLLYSVPAMADTARDTAVDTALGGNGRLTGALPATAGEAVPAGGIFGAQQAFVDPSRPDKFFPDPASMVSDKSDKKGRVFEMKGKAKILKKGTPEWKSLTRNTWVEEGDAILTEKGAAVSVTFDAKYLNVSHLPENTRAIFRGIEPLDLMIEDGTVFNLFDAIPAGSDWKVSTPTAVAAVRGTYFVLHFTASDGSIFTATFNVPDDGHSSKVELSKLTGGSVDVPEGKEVNVKEGQPLDSSLLGDIDQDWIDQMEEILKHIQDFRNEHGGQLPTTNGEFFDPNTHDPEGSNNVGGGLGDSDIDPLDVNSAGTTPQEEVSEEPKPESSYGPPPFEGGGDER